MAITDKQLRFEFMDTMPEQLSPAAKRKDYVSYLRSIRDERPLNQIKRGGNDVAKTKRRTNVSANR